MTRTDYIQITISAYLIYFFLVKLNSPIDDLITILDGVVPDEKETVKGGLPTILANTG